MTAEFRLTPGHPGYRVGDDGSVWTLWTQRGTGRGNAPIRYIGTEWRKLQPSLDKYGRPVVNLKCDDGRIRQRKVCQLVLESFVGPRPSGMQACHFPDADKANCNRDNLRWDTQSGNQHDRVVHGTSNRGERCGTAKLTPEQVRQIIAEYKSQTASAKELADRFNVTPGHVCRMARGERWQYSV